MATEDEAREAADGTEVQVEAVNLGTVHLQAHPEGKLSSVIKSMGETIDSTEGTLKIPEDQVLVEAPSDVQLPPEHNLNGGHTDKEEKVSNEQPHDSNQEEAELDQSNGINKEDVTDGLSHGESTTEDSCLLKHKKDEEPKGDDQQDLGVTVDDDSVQEDVLKTDNADGQQDQNQETEKENENTEPLSITNNADVDNAIEQTDDGQQDQNQEPEKAHENTEPACIANNADVEIVAEAPTGLQAPVEPCMDDSDGILEIIDQKTETDEPAKADGVVHPEEVAKVEDQQSQQADTMDADVAPEEIKCEETDQQEEKPKSEAYEPIIYAQGVLNQECAEETDDPVDEKIEETANQRNVAAPKETILEHEATMSAPPVNTQVQNQESLEEIEHTEAEIQPRSGFGDAIPEDQSNLGVTIHNDTVNEDIQRAIEQGDDGQQDDDLEPEKATEHTESPSMKNIPHAEIVTEAPSGVQTPGEPNVDNSDAVPDTIDTNIETDDPAKLHAVIHPDQKESLPEDTSTAEPTQDVVKAEDQQNQQAEAMYPNMVQEEEPKSEHADEPATDALEVLNQESAEEIDGPVNTEETAHRETTPEYDTTTREPPVDIQAQNQESLEEREATVKEREVAEAVDTEAPVQQSSVAVEEAVPEDQHNLGVKNKTVQEDTLEATGQTKYGEQYQDLGPENATENTQPASMANISDVEVITEVPSGIQTPVEINLDMSDAIPDTTDRNTETDEPAKTHTVVHPDNKESFPEDTSTTAEPTEEVVRVEDQQSQQADAMDADVVQEVVPRSENTDEPATDALEVLNQESAEETNGPLNEKTEETASNMPASEERTPESGMTAKEPPVTIQVQNQESLEEREATEEEREVAEAVDTEASVQQSSVAFEEAVPEDQHYLGVTNNTVQEDTLETTGQTEDGEQHQDPGPENATEKTQPASMENIPDVEVITKAPSEIQTPVEINLDIYDPIPDATDGNTETDEPAKAHTVVHPEKKESFPEDTCIAEPTEEVIKVEDQLCQQADAIDADGLQEEVPKSEHAEPGVDAQEVLNQESAEETDGLVNVKTEKTEHKSNMVVPEDTMPEHDAQMREPPVNIQEQSLESVGDVEAVNTEAEMQQSSVAFEETTPENHVATSEPCSEIQHVHHVEPEEINVPGDAKYGEITNMSSTENLVQDNILQTGPVIDIQPVQELEQIKTDEASSQTHAVVFNDLAQEDATATSEPQVTETEELKDIGATEAEEITKLDHVTPSEELAVENDSAEDEPHNGEIHQTLEQDLVEVKDTETYHEKTLSTSEDTVEDNLTAGEPSCGSQEVDNAESREETKHNIAESISEVSDVVIADEAIEQNVLQTEDINETHKQELEPEEMKSTEPVESEEASDLNASKFNYSDQEDNAQECELRQTESATEIREIEPTEVEAVPRESNACVSAEPSQEDHIKESETSCDNQEVNITESLEVIDGHKDIITGGISGQSNTASAGDSAEESNVPEGEPPADIQAVQELGSEESIQIDEVNETSLEMNATVFQMPTQEENPATTKLHESTEVSNIEATEVHGNPYQSDAAALSEAQATKEIASGLKRESTEDNATKANEPHSTSQEKIISTPEESVTEEIATEDIVITEPDVDHQQLQDQESTEIKETEADTSQEIASSNTLSSERSTSEDNATSTEPSSDTQADNSQLAEETEDTEDVKSNTALAEAAAPETDATADASSFHEADLEETKDTGTIETEDVMTLSDNTSEKMDMKTMETEAEPHESNVANIKERTEDDTSTQNAPQAGTELVRELESVEDCTDTTEHPGGGHGSTSDELNSTEENTTVTEPSFNTQEAQNLTSQEIKDNEDNKTDEFSDISSFPTPREADQVPRTEPTPDLQELQELGLTEETRDIEAMEPEDQQDHIVSTLEKPAVDGEPNVDDQHVHEDKLPEVEEIQADEASKQSNVLTPDNAAEERNELESVPDSYAQPAEQVELSKDNENSQLVKVQEISVQSNSVALEERTTKDSVASEIDPPVDIQPVEEIKGVDATEAEEDFHASQADAIEKLASDNNITTAEPTYDIQQVDDLEATEETKNAEAINDGEQSNSAVSEEPTPTDNGETPEGQRVESNEGTTGNETENAILAHGIKDEIQKSSELKDDACDLGEIVLTTQRSENKTDEDAVQTSGNDTLEASNNIHQVKEEPNAGIEHNSSQMSSEHNGENTTHVQDRDVEGQVLTESGIAEAPQALFENDPQAAQDTTQKDGTTKGSEQTSDHDSRQHGDLALQQQSYETDVLSIEKQDEAPQKIGSDQNQKEYEETESQNDELQVDEQKHEDERDALTTEPQVEYQNFENEATNRTEDNDAFEAEQTESTISEILKNDKALSKESTPSIMDIKVENITDSSEGTEGNDDAKNDNKDEKENPENDDIVAKTSTNEQGKTTDEIRNEELESGLASSVQASDPAPSKDKILENDPVHIIQASEKEITDEIEESTEMQEDNAICLDELQTNSEKEESPQLHSNEPYNMDTKIDDTTPLCEEEPREIEEIGENKGLNSTSETFIESSIQNNVEDSSSHHKVEDEKVLMSDKNDVDTEAMQEKIDESAADINQKEQCQEEINSDDVLQLEREESLSDKIKETASHEETETSNTTASEALMINEDITDKVSRADGALSDGSLKTFTDAGRDLDVSLVITSSKEESTNDNMQDLNLDLPEHPAQDDNTNEKVLSLEETEREMPSSEKLLQTEPGETQIPNAQDEKDIQYENQTPKEKNEDDMQDTEIGEAKKEVEQELPVSHFLMNLILGKESSDANGDSESEAARKQDEAIEDGRCAFISKQEEGSLPTENKVDDNLTLEQGKHEVKCSEETQEMVKEQSDDLKLDTERSTETDEDIKNTHDLEIPAYQDNLQDEISGELLTEGVGVSTKMETRDIAISSVELDDRTVGTVCQENMAKDENGSLRSSLNDSTNTKASEEDTLGGQTGLMLESLPADKSVDAVSEQAPSLTESGITDANDLSSDTESVQNPVSATQDKPTGSSSVEATCSTDIQLENEVDKKEEERHANTATDEVSEENVDSSHVNLQKITSSEVTSNELATQITEPVCDTLAHEKNISEENFPTAVEIQADGPNLQINQDKQDEIAMEPEKLGESNFQEHQEIGTEQKSPKETDEGDQQLLAKKEILTQEQAVHETVESPEQTVSIKSNEDRELFDSKVQERDLNAVSFRKASEAEENFVDVSKLWLTQSPKADAEEKIYDEKIKDIEETKNFTDEVAMKTEAPGAAQKARKKPGLLSGVGSKVKQQLGKVKKAIVGKPGRTKPESPKA